MARLSTRTLLTDDETIIDLHTVDDEAESPTWMTADRNRELWALFRRLPTRCQLLLRLLIEENALSYRDLGEVLEMPIGSIGPTRARCLDRLRRLAEASGILLRDEVS